MRRFLIITSSVVAVVVLGWIVLIGAVYAWGGVATVRVQDRDDGVTLYLPVPMALVEAAVTTGSWVVPEEEWLDLDVEIGEWGEWGPMIRELLVELDKMPDVTLVEVQDGATTVKVYKEHGKLKVRVDDEDVHVRVSVPMRSARRTLSRLSRII